MEKQKLDVKITLPYQEAIDYLEDMLKSLKDGKVVVQKGTEYVSMTPGETVTMELGAKTKKNKQKFSFEISWTDDGEGDLVISGKEPVFAAQETSGESVKDAPAEDSAKAKPEAATPEEGKEDKKQSSPAAPAKAAPKAVANKEPAKSAPKKTAAKKTTATKSKTSAKSGGAAKAKSAKTAAKKS
ncbi:amphi-Trp domain-containing protein [Salidesulfovibrio brasiliensis]|uniref:amphi-Trp domain-containing protein n=1 Tax=Salidesulfovibrio brasiliensis TaxID=221711 RepID=UPI0006D19EED|nr:amphi-Trp domain-containing protein [Salidesulfovibrio brasiliensis]